MNAVLQNLLKLQVIEFGAVAGKHVQSQAAELRGLIPQPFLGHYDRLKAREKKGIAIVRNQVCTGCHMKVPVGTIATVLRGEDIQICDSCGRYLYVEAPVQGEPAAPVGGAQAPAKAPKKPRKRKALAGAA